MKAIPRILSKTKIMRGYQCPKNLYLTIHRPEVETPITPDQQARFDQGNVVGAEARKRFPGGVLVDNAPWDFIGSLKKTRELLSAQTEVIFEAAFEHKGLYARADIIVHNKETGRWNVFEVKSSLKVKEEQVQDVRLQTWIMVQCGLPIEKVSLWHLNPDCVHPQFENLFVEVDLTEKVRENYSQVLPKLKSLFEMIRSSQEPVVPIGPQCASPYDCGFKAHCWQEHQVPALSVFQIPQIREKAWEFFEKGILRLDDPQIEGLSDLQKRMVEVSNSGVRFCNSAGIQQALKSWQFPLVFLDFETISPAIPRYPGTRPYSQVPFQFSVHVWREKSEKLEHFEYLATGGQDSRRELIQSLLQACGTEGSIVAYYAEFEKSRIEELAQCFPEFQKELLALAARLVDPLPILREHVYDPGFHGSFSLKKVGPALLGSVFSYQDLKVADGLACQRAFEQMIDSTTSEEKKQNLRQWILEYCKRDTLVMVELVRWMKLVSPATEGIAGAKSCQSLKRN